MASLGAQEFNVLKLKPTLAPKALWNLILASCLVLGGCSSPEWRAAMTEKRSAGEADLGLHMRTFGLDTMSFRANMLYVNGDIQGALKEFGRLIAAIEGFRADALRVSPQIGRKRFSRYVSDYQAYMRILAESNDLARAFHISELTKARMLLEQMSEAVINSGGVLSPDEAAALKSLEEQSQTAETRLLGETGTYERVYKEASYLTSSRELANLRAKLKTKYPAYARLMEINTATLADAPRLLKSTDMFISFVVPRGERVAFAFAADSSHVTFVAFGHIPGLAETVEALRVWVSMPEGAEITDDSGRVLQIIRWDQGGRPRWRVVAREGCEIRQCGPQDARVVTGPAELKALCEYLGNALIEPIAARLPGKKRLVISPDGPLGLIPFDLLEVRGKRLIELYDVSLIHSLSVLKAVAERQAEYLTSRGQRTLLAFGNPHYGEESSSTAAAQDPRGRVAYKRRAYLTPADKAAPPLSTAMFEDLPGTKREVEAAQAVFGKAGSRIIQGDQATETNLRQLSITGELASYKYLLFSAHGHFDAKAPQHSGLLLKSDGPDSERDGFVTALEWPSIRMRSQLVILSACETGRGEAVSGEGQMGLAYSLFIAGTVNSVLTLWQVSDEPTAEFVASFLGRIRQGLSAPTALADTKRQFMVHKNRLFREPFVWAAFHIYGA